MIQAKQVTLTYPDGTEALKAFDLIIEKGDIVYVVGPSGSGKTSLLKMLLGEVKPTTGLLRVMGKDIGHTNHEAIKAMRRKIGPVFQAFRLMEGHTVEENVLMGLRFLNFSKKEMDTQLKDSVAWVGLSHKMKSKVGQLSFGESQRIAIARAIARKPELIIADEPTGNLDHENAIKILKLLTAFQDGNRVIVISTHATHLIAELPKGKLIAIASGTITTKETSGESL